MLLSDLIEPAAVEKFLKRGENPGLIEEACRLSIAISLRRLADAMGVRDLGQHDWPDAPRADTQFEPDAQHLSADDVDMAGGMELALALHMAHQSGRYHGMIVSLENQGTGRKGLLAPVPLLCTLFHGRSEAEITRMLLSIPGSDIEPHGFQGDKRIFVSTADLRV